MTSRWDAYKLLKKTFSLKHRSSKQRWITAMFPSNPKEVIEQTNENDGLYFLDISRDKSTSHHTSRNQTLNLFQRFFANLPLIQSLALS